VNKYVYWVSTNSFESWTLLPDLKPSDIGQSRNIKVLFTGDLERDIITNPYFFGKEKHYLRSQIARISFSTTLIPKWQLRLSEEGEVEAIPEEEGFKIASTEELTCADNWQHVTQNILKCNKMGHSMPEELPEGVEEEDFKKQLEAADPFEAKLKPISADNDWKGSKAWNIQLKGEQERYGSLDPKQAAGTHSGVAVVKSLVWPGSTTLW